MANAGGRPTAPLALEPEEREYLERQVRRRRVARSMSERCRIILRCAEGIQSKVVAAELGVHDIPVCTVPAPSSLANGRAGFADLRTRHPDIDAVFCGSDVIAHGVITEAQALGLSIPGDVAVMGFGDLPFAAFTHPSLSTVRVDGTSIGRQAARFILDRAENRDVGSRVRDLGFTITKRASA